MNKVTYIISDETKQRLLSLADATKCHASRGAAAGKASIKVLLERIAASEDLLEIIEKKLNNVVVDAEQQRQGA